MSTLEFRACRINGNAYVEIFEGEKALAVVWEKHEPTKHLWGYLYEQACKEADRLNELMVSKPEAKETK